MQPQNPALDYYYERYKSRPSDRPVAQIDPVDQTIDEMRDRRIRQSLLRSGSPDTIGRATMLSRELDVEPLLLEDRMADAERGRDVRRFMSMTEQYPAIGKWAVAQPRGAAAASDDWDSLSLLGKSWRTVKEVATGIVPSILGSGLMQLGGEADDLVGAAYDVSEAVSPMPAIEAGFAEAVNRIFGTNWRPDKDRERRNRIVAAARQNRRDTFDRAADDLRPKSTSWVARELLAGTESIPLSAMALLTRDPKAAAGVMGTLVGAGAYQDARDAGKDIGTALAYGGRQGIVEGGTELFPASKLLGDIAARSPFGKMILHQLVTEIPGEQAATLLQDFDTWVTLNPEKTIGEFIAERPDAVRQTLLGTIGAVGTTTTAVRTAQKVTEGAALLAARRGEAARAAREGAILEQAGDAARKSKLRDRDPDAFAGLMRGLAEDSGATDVYIPAEAIQEYMQSGDFDADAWAEFEQQSIEAMATGGDVVLPVERVLTTFPGTPAWEALRDHMRLSPGGMSRFEAESFNAEIADLRQTMEEQAAAIDEFDREMMEARERLVTNVVEKLQAAGYTPSVARTQAELVTARYETRAMRKGQMLSGREFDDVDVVQILPEQLALRQKNDGLDRVINAMRRGTAGARQGPSLLEFIARRGGIDDPGGDIASMGGDAWHRRAPFRKRLLRRGDKGQASFIGGAQRDTAPEDVLRAAIDAGYFPELAGRDAATAEDALDNNLLLEAIGAELRGDLRYASEADTSLSDAALELATILANEGLDPASATRREIRNAVAAYASRNAAEGRNYQQAGLREEIAAAWEGRQNRGFIDLGPMPKALVDFGLPSGNLRIGRAKIGAIAEKHSVSADILAKLPAYLEQPWAIYPSTLASPQRFVVALRVRDSNGNPILAVIQPDGDIAVVNSVYGKEGMGGLSGDDVVRRAIAREREQGRDVYEGEAPPAGYPELITGMRPEKRNRPILSLSRKSKDGQSLEQGDEAGGTPRGRIIFPSGEFTGTAIIELHKSRNLSTFLHETGHLWLEELRTDALSEDATNRLRDDWGQVTEWFAANGHPIENGIIPVEAHEMWARGVEQYLMGGKAPVPALRGIFEQFRAWLVSIYRSVKALRSPLTPEIRRVMDRLIATDDDIALAGQEQSTHPLLTDASDMTQAEFAAYQRLVADARIEARGQLLDRTVRDVRARNTKRYRNIAAELRDEIETSVAARPAFRAIDAMKTQPIDRRWVVSMMGDEAAEMMPRGVPPLMRGGGVHPDAIAEQSGFATGYEMIEALIELEIAHRTAREEGDQRTMRNRIIEEELDVMMRDRYGEPLTDGSIEREAIAAVHNEMQGEVIAAEVRVLGRKAGQPPTPYSAAQEWARQKIRSGLVSVEAMPGALQRYARASRKAARMAEAAYLDRDIERAFRAKQQQMLNNALYSEAKKAHEEVDAARGRLQRIASKRAMKGVDQSYLEQAQALLEAVDLKQRTMKAIDRKTAFEKWLASRADGEEVIVPDSLDWTGTNWTKLSVEALLGLDDSISSIIHLGRLKRTLLDNKAKRDFEEWRDEALRSIEATPGRKITNELGDPSRPIAGLFSNLMKMETFAGEMDNGAVTGVWQRLLVERATEAANYRDSMRDEILTPIAAAYNAMPNRMRDRLANRITVPEMLWRSPDPNDPRNGHPLAMTRWDIVGMALNLGTESNLEKLARGYGISENVAENIVRRNLSKEEWQFVQGVWDALELLRPHIAKVEREMTGLEPEWLDARPVETPFGVLRGGYYPIKFDPAQSQRAEDNEADSMNDLFGSRSGVATHKGHTVTRTGYVAPLLLSPEQVLFSHVEKIITRNAYAPWLRDVLKAVKDAPIRAALDRKFGPEFRHQIEPWLRAQVREGLTNEQGTRAVESWLRAARINMTVVAMGLRWSTGVAQTVGIANSIGRVGIGNMRRGMQKTLANPAAAAEFVFARSPEMARRNETMNRDVAEAFRQMRKARLDRSAAARTASTWQAKAQAFAFWHIGMIDRYVVSIPTWLAAYEKGTREGMDDVAASAFADKAVRLSQGSGREKDLSAWQSNQASEGLKFFTMFYTPFNALLNAQWEAGRAARRGDYRKAATLAFWYMIATPLLDALLAGDAPGGDDDDEAWVTWLARNIGFYLAAGIPIVRDGATYAERKMTGKFATFSTGPLGRIFESGKNSVTLAWDAALGEDEVSDRWIKTAIETPGYFLGLPTGQLSSTGQFLADVTSGKVDPEGFWDWYNGLTIGRVE